MTKSSSSPRWRFNEMPDRAVIDWLFLPQRCFLIHTVTAPLNFKFVDHLRPPWSKCSRPLMLTRLESKEPGFDLRVYYCAACEASETIIGPV